MDFSIEGMRSTKAHRTKTALHLAKRSGSAPDKYASNSHKEHLCLEYVKDFKGNFGRLFPGRELYITAPNELGVEKLVCSTLRPTQLPFRELYDVNKCRCACCWCLCCVLCCVCVVFVCGCCL